MLDSQKPASLVPPRISVVIVAFDMARQLGRTLHSLSPAMQNGIRAEDYEVIVVDNGSTPTLDPDEIGGGSVGVRYQWPEVEPLFFGSLSPVARAAFEGGA